MGRGRSPCRNTRALPGVSGTGNLAGRSGCYYRFALACPAIDGILCVLRHPREVAALCRALAAPPLDADEESYLIDLARLSTGKARLV